MTVEAHIAERFKFLIRVVDRECRHLATTDTRLFENSFSLEQVAQLEKELELAERVDAFVGRFGRLQNTLGDKRCHRFWIHLVKSCRLL